MNKFIEFDTNPYLGDYTYIGFPIVDSEEYSLERINICLNISNVTISTESISDTFVKIKENILKLLRWIMDTIKRFIDMIKKWFYNLNKTIDNTIQSFIRFPRTDMYDNKTNIRNEDKFINLHKHILLIDNSLSKISDFIINNLQNKVSSILDSCINQLNDLESPINYRDLCLIKDILYLSNDSIYTLVNNEIKQNSIPKSSLNNVELSKLGMVDALKEIKNTYKDNIHNSKLDIISKLYNNLYSIIENDTSSDTNKMNHLLKKITLLGVTIPNNIIKTELLLVKETIDAYRYISSTSILSPLDFNLIMGGTIPAMIYIPRHIK